MATLDIAAHLETELASPDPWGLDGNPFETRRFHAILDQIRPDAPYGRGLEVGCAAGAFTAALAPLCRRLDVVDVMPTALSRAAERLGHPAHVTWRVADVAAAELEAEAYDLIVAAEVLYYLPDAATLARAVAGLSAALAPGGRLVLGSAVDQAAQRWGLIGGAETAMDLFSRLLREEARTSCRGADAGEDCLVVSYVRHKAKL